MKYVPVKLDKTNPSNLSLRVSILNIYKRATVQELLATGAPTDSNFRKPRR
jgi:hypothetical protein